MNELVKLFYDLKNYSWHSPITSPSWTGLVNFRIAAFLWKIKYFKAPYYLYFLVWRVILLIVGIEIYGKTEIGMGLKINHFGQIFINPKTIIGKNCLIYNGVTIGNKKFEGGESPIIGNDVKIGAGAKVLGEIKIGDNVGIGANSVITKSVEKNKIIAGNPAKIIK
jgi:serine O-acetyltransferase